MGCTSSKSSAPGSDPPARPVANTNTVAPAPAAQNGIDIAGIKLDLEGRIEPLARSILVWCGFDGESPGAIDIYLSEFQHSLDILKAWFGSIDDAQTSLRGRRVIDLGCGRAFMTIVLAYMVAESTPAGGAGKVIGVDDPARSEFPASATIYERLARSTNVSKHVEWIKLAPVDFLAEGSVAVDYVCIVHPRIDFGIGLDLFTFMQKFRFWCSGAQPRSGGLQPMSASGSGAKLLLARWSLECSEPAAQVHVKAVMGQCASKAFTRRRRLIVPLAEMDDYMQAAGWREEKHERIIRPELNAAIKDVQLTRSLMQDPKEDIRSIGGDMEALLAEYGTVKCMDVWTAVYSNAVTTLGVY